MGNNNNFRHTANQPQAVNVAPAKAGNKVVNKRNGIIAAAVTVTIAAGVGIYKLCTKKKCTKKAEEPASAPAEQATQA